MDQQYVHKLTSAVYRVTERLNDAEPLKWKLRERALAISDIADRKELLDEEREKLFSKSLAEMTRLLELASTFSFVAKVNFETLLREYLGFGSKMLTSPSQPIETQTPQVQEKFNRPTRQSSSTRQETILVFLKSQQNVSIGEVVHHFSGSVSEKTIQRDLADLIAQGQVVAVGDKRWRRYSIGQ